MPSPMISKVVQYMADNYSKDSGKLLVHLGALGWVLSSAAQLGVVAGDRNIDKKKKKFLLSQEAADAGVNVVMYYTICDVIKKGGDKLVESGKLLTKEVVDALGAIKGGSTSVSDPTKWRNLFTKAELEQPLTKMLEMGKNLSIVKGLQEKDAALAAINNALTAVETHKNNVSVISAIAASVLACNLVTPYVRNIIASKFQKRALEKEALDIRKTQIKENITLKNPLPTSFKSFNNYNSFGSIKI